MGATAPLPSLPPPPSSTSLFDPEHRPLVRAAVHLAYANPFVEDPSFAGPIAADLWTVMDAVRERLSAGCRAGRSDLDQYERAAVFLLRDRYEPRFDPLISARGAVDAPFYDDFLRDYRRLLDPLAPIARDRHPGAPHAPPDPAHLFACLYQTRRAFSHLTSTLIGASPAIVDLRASVYNAVFTRDLGRYVRSLRDRMAGIALLVTGPTGTGKELVARAVGLSGYVPFDAPRRRFLHRPEAGYTALTLSSVSASLLESELFGHARGAFTGATHDREGYLDRCGPGGTLFLDEIGDLPADVQVKLLRLVQFRTYHRVGEAEERTFAGKIVVATWRDLHALARAGTFRDDLYYRLRGNRIVTPSLHQILEAAPGDRRALVHHIALDVAGPAEADALTEEVEAWISQNLPRYPWPGNVRELEQCVKSVMVFGDYQADEVPPETSEDPVFDKDVREGNLSFDALGDRYITFVRARSSSNLEAARKLVLNPRTVRTRTDQALLARLNKKKG